MALTPKQQYEKALLGTRENKFGSAKPPKNTGVQVYKNTNKDLFRQQTTPTVQTPRPGAGSTLMEQKAWDQNLSNQFGAPSGVPNSNVSTSEQNRRNQALDPNLGIGMNSENSAFLGKDINTVATGSATQARIFQEKSKQAQEAKEVGFENYKKNLQETPEIAEYRAKLQADIAEQENRTGKASVFTMARLSRFDRNSLAGKIAIARGLDPTNTADRNTINEELRQQYTQTDEYQQIADEVGFTAEDVQRGVREASFGGATLTEDQISEQLGLNAGQKLYWNDNTSKYEVRTGAIEDSDPFVRAEAKLQTKKENALADIDEQYANAIARARANVAQYGNNQARQNLADLLRRKDKAVKRTTEAIDTSLEDLAIQEEQRQSSIEEVMLQGEAELTLEQQKTLEKANWIAEQQMLDPTAKVAYLENKWKDINKYEEVDPNAKANISTWETMMMKGEVDVGNQSKTFAQAIDLTGDAEKAYELIKTTGDAETAKEFRSAWTEERYGTEAMTRQDAISRVNEMFTGEDSSPDAIDAFVKESEKQFDDVFIANQLDSIANSYGADPLVKQVAQDYLDAEYGKFLGEAEEKGEFKLMNIGGQLVRANAQTGEYETLIEAEKSGDELDVDAIVDGILMSRTGFDANDIPVARRAAVQKRLAERQAELMADGTFKSKLAASAGGRMMNATEVSSIAKAQTVISQLESLGDKLEDRKEKTINDEDGNSWDIEPLTGWLSKNNPWDTNAQEIEQILNSTIPNLARGVYGEVGVLTNQDVELYKTTIPNLSQTADVKSAVMALTLRTVRNQIENQLSTLADAKTDVSGFRDTYDTLNRQIADIESRLGIVAPEAVENLETGNTQFTQDQVLDVGLEVDEVQGLSIEDQKIIGREINRDIDNFAEDIKWAKENNRSLQEVVDYYKGAEEPQEPVETSSGDFTTKEFAGRAVTLKPEAMTAFEKANADFKAETGQDIKIGAIDTSSARTQEQQFALYGKGRTAEQLKEAGVPTEYADPNANIVTQTTKSRHMEGKAIDLFPFEIEVNGQKYEGKSYASLVKPFLEKHGIKQDTAGIGDYVNFEYNA